MYADSNEKPLIEMDSAEYGYGRYYKAAESSPRGQPHDHPRRGNIDGEIAGLEGGKGRVNQELARVH